MNDKIERVLIDEKTLKARIAEMGAQISRDYAGEELVVIGLLKGAAYFLTELTEHITVPVRIDFIKASSYGSGTKSSGKVDIDYDTSRNIASKNILLVDDVVDTGLTLKAVVDKKERRLVKVLPDYAGFEIPDEFVVGFGLDYDEEFRNLPYIGILKRSVYEK